MDLRTNAEQVLDDVDGVCASRPCSKSYTALVFPSIDKTTGAGYVASVED